MPKKSSSTSKKESEIIAPGKVLHTYLNDEELEHFKSLLLKRREEVLRDLDILRSSLSEESVEDSINSNYSMHMADHGTETMDREQRFMFIARDEKYLGYIDQALERIRNKTYGMCVKSGKPIPKKRLEAVPHTSVRIEFKENKKK
ncbi:molecular chaperone DnaK [Prosthecochloris sp. HL-130-GSB]|jgi:DnaK suppressor protein|uniref:TraR/DksA family transcriptional regulator n=1 Tax=Prosthecochloris sp. HL-130-GSB TaxID=1974213 RepID=UPI000A1C0BBD|nr:molecular chaperone DnaK [Prosthecochloris sp. HL-130-GSB]ARM30502.1 molecular chaperone DnaK [Prosthecochloris sp. HL-130-GSB]MBO8093723.1 molecular chaperone DnaK [Prosthecochloris sp.]